ncbi:peroxisomal membrane anchor protein conserved region-domain-containing protein [Coniella lustricola]|uniref:Peroxisomal membrane protein PEX14 n=1 Tax=Coniella lustricola TaxID=2025994 RepID=A0A2T3ADW1_9PEZI|nr:peroxisomal membrane anchor protein conserved region-domain-containing protein [Coniella lustricola]
MGDADDSSSKTQTAASIPSWQQAAQQPKNQTSEPPSTQVTLEQARLFLQDESVKDADSDKKVEFLKSKGLQQTDIDTLLRDSAESSTAARASTTSSSSSSTEQPAVEPPATQIHERQPDISSTSFSSEPASRRSSPVEEPQSNRPPIVTYPEFLTEPLKPPPLITAAGLFNSLGIIAGFSALVYGATKHLVSPMVDSLTDARVELHQNAAKNLSQLVERLENAVSELPPGYDSIGKSVARFGSKNATATATQPPTDDNSSDSSTYDDPSELFHRDIGVQTSLPPSAPSTPDLPDHPTTPNNAARTTHAQEIQHQADRLARIQVGMRTLSHGVTQSAEDLAATKSVIGTLSSDLHNLRYPPESYGTSSTYLYGASRNEPDDEIKRVKTSIRSVKGALLSTRSFPASAR